jgi:ABC-2 type transport system permease protein
VSATTAVEQPRAEVVASDSRTLNRALQDLRTGFAQRELWAHLGWQDIKQRYRRSYLGPIWITIATGVTALAMGLLYSQLFKIDLATFLPHITVGLIVWTMLSGFMLEGSEVFIVNEGLIKQLPAPLSVHVYRMVWRQMLLFAHNLIIYVILLAIYFPAQGLHWTSLLAVPALALLGLNGVWLAIVVGIVATRFRDVSPIIGSLVQLLFFMTPIVWTAAQLPKNPDGSLTSRARLVEVNPLFHFLEIIRAPMLGDSQYLYHWLIVIAITVVGWALALFFLRNYRARVAYWV